MDFLQGVRLKRHPYNNWLMSPQGCYYKSYPLYFMDIWSDLKSPHISIKTNKNTYDYIL